MSSVPKRARRAYVRAAGLGLGLYARTDGVLQAARERARGALERLLSRTLDPDELTAASIAVYSSVGQVTHADRPLFAWESALFRERLPPPPARVLVGGAGAGREVRALLELGYAVDAFEPARSSHAALHARFGERGAMCFGSYADLDTEALAPLRGPYDAVLCGWSSLGHVLGHDARVRTLRALSARAPRGPILASFWLGDHAADVLTAHAGFMHRFCADELEALARAIDRTLVLSPGEGTFPHAAFMPKDA